MDRDKVLISVIIPVYNAEKYLSRCLESVSMQTYASFEVIMIDDGSTDNSKSICRAYTDKDDRFKYVYQDNAGPDMARKTGTNAAIGEYVTYVDADDYISENALEVMINNADETSADIICSQIVRFDKKKEWPGSIYNDGVRILKEKAEILDAFFVSETLIGTYYAKLIKRSVMEGYSFIKEGLIGEDITAALYMFDKANTISLIPDKTYYYYQNSDSISHAKYSNRHAVSLDNYIKLRDLYLNRDGVTPQRICGYFAAYQMAVATAMGRSGSYEKESGELLRKDLKDHWEFIKNDSKTALYMKLCIWLYMYMPKVFIGLFHVLYVFTGR
jgi:glycosyltransferase involved in cell wall biosynthesis